MSQLALCCLLPGTLPAMQQMLRLAVAPTEFIMLVCIMSFRCGCLNGHVAAQGNPLLMLQRQWCGCG